MLRHANGKQIVNFVHKMPNLATKPYVENNWETWAFKIFYEKTSYFIKNIYKKFLILLDLP